MKIPGNETARSQSWPMAALWLLLAFYAGANILPVFPQAFPRTVLVASQIVPAMLFVMIHGAIAYRVRGVLAYAAISLTVGYLMEALGVRTGFPFGHYSFADGMGPKLFLVPVLMGPAYLGIGYIAWTMARVILTHGRADTLPGPWVFTLPLAASFIMVAWDLSIDPALSTVGRYWIWRHGGAYFGVPVTNFLGWYLTNYLIYQLFALYLRRWPAGTATLPPVVVRLAVLLYATCALGSVLRVIPRSALSTVTDPGGAVWSVNDINAVCALAAIFIMGAFAVLALARLAGRTSDLVEADSQQEAPYRTSTVPILRQDEVEQAR